MHQQPKRTSLIIIGLFVLAAFVSLAAASGQASAAPSVQMDMATATPTPAAPATGAAESAPAVISGTDEQAQPQVLPTPMSGMGCPMMNGNMASMGSMSGMQGMPGMGSMAGMQGMSGMGNMPGMGMNGMSGMQSMGSNMQGMGMTNMNSLAVQDEIEAGAFWRINPWWLVGWLVFFILVIAVLAAVSTWLVWFISHTRRPQVAKVTHES